MNHSNQDNNVKNSYSVPPVDRAIRLLRYIGEGNKCRNLAKASKQLSINRTTLIRLIHSLLDNGMLEEIGEDEGYRLGIETITLASQAIQSRNIVRVSLQPLQELVKKSNMSAHLGILDDIEVVYLSRETPKTHLVSNMHIGSRLPAYASSIGRVIISELNETEVKNMFKNKELKGATDIAPKNIKEILSQRKIDSERGYVWSFGMIEENIGSCAATIFNYDGIPVGGLNVSGPKDVFVNETSKDAIIVKEAVLEAARKASEAMGFRSR